MYSESQGHWRQASPHASRGHHATAQIRVMQKMPSSNTHWPMLHVETRGNQTERYAEDPRVATAWWGGSLWPRYRSASRSICSGLCRSGGERLVCVVDIALWTAVPR